jgi:hypothetical protein
MKLKLIERDCTVGDYQVTMEHKTDGKTYPSYDTAEKAAIELSRKNPGKHVEVSQIAAVFKGHVEVLEVHAS